MESEDACQMEAHLLQWSHPASTPSSGEVLLRGRLDRGVQVDIFDDRVLWRSGGLLQHSYLCTGKPLQVAVCRFTKEEEQQVCILQPKLLSVCSINGEAATVPLPSHFTDIFPLDYGLLLTGSEESSPKILQHPSEDLQAVPTEYKSVVGSSQTEPSNAWRGERVLWLGAEEAPYALTFNKKLSRARLWQFRRGASTANQLPYDVSSFWTPQQAKVKRSTMANSPASGSGMKRPGIRLPNGLLSPAAFSPVPQAVTNANLPPVSLLPLPPLPYTVQLIAEHGISEENCPSEAALFHDLGGGCLLAMLNKQVSYMTVIRLPANEGAFRSGTFEVVCEHAAVALVAVPRGKQPLQVPSHGHRRDVRPLKDLLVLAPNGQLRLFVGGGLTLRVTLPPLGPGSYEPPLGAVLARGGASPRRRSPIRQRRAGSFGSDVSMCSAGSPDTDVQMTPSSPQRRACPKVMDVKSGGGSQAVVVVEDGSEALIALPFLPQCDAVTAAFAALHFSVSPAVVSWIVGRMHSLGGGSCQSPEEQWSAFSDAVLAWAGQVVSGAQGGQSVSGTPQTPPPSASTAWDALQQSQQHMSAVSSGHFKWLPGGMGHSRSAPPVKADTQSSEAWKALESLHCMYEDMKLNVRQWRHLECVGATLAHLAGLLGAARYLESYQRDLKTLPPQQAPMGAGVAGSGQPASIYHAIFAILTGQQAQQWLSPIFAQQPAFLRRSCDLLHFFKLVSEASEAGSSGQEVPPALMAVSRQLVMAMVEKGWDQAQLSSLPFGISYPLKSVLSLSRAHPPSGWPVEAYQLVGRADIVANLCSPDVSVEAKAAQSATGSTAGSSSNRPVLHGRTPLAKPQLRTPLPGGMQKSRMSLGGDPVLAAAAAQATAVPVQTADKEGGSRRSKHLQRHCMPYAQRLDLPGIMWEASDPAEAEVGSSEPDGMESVEAMQRKQRFGPDLRIMEVRKLLRSCSPTPIHIRNASSTADAEMTALQQKRLMALAVRTMALPCGRAAFTLGTLTPLPTEPLSIPQLNLSGLLPEQQNAVVKLDLTSTTPAPGGGAAADFTAWPEFHNGVAAGLRLAPGGTQMTRTWIVYNKPKEPSYTHAGMLMGLGLTGHLNCLAATDLYRYLSQEHDATTAGVLLGMAAAKRGTCDATISKMLFLHLPSRFSAILPDLELSSLVQSAAILGVGLLYQGSCHRLTVEMMLDEIGRRPGVSADTKPPVAQGVASSGTTIAADREGYALSAGLALGLICLGHGHNAVGLSDMHIEERLRFYMAGGKDPSRLSRSGKHLETAVSISQARADVGAVGFDPTRGGEMPWRQPGISPRDHRATSNVPSAAQGQSQLVIEGNIPNLDVTAPGGILGLALMYLQTNDRSIADSLSIPATAFDLDLVRPDFIMLRMLARSLVMWDHMRPTRDWLVAQLPPLIRGPLSEVGWPPANRAGMRAEAAAEDPEAIAQAHASAVTGACLAMGIRYAGTGNPEARQTLLHYVDAFLKAKMAAPDPFSGAAAVWGRLDKQALENCMDVIALALSLVMAGTGDLETLRLLRGLRRRMSQGAQNTAGAVFFGNHMAINMALGFLLYGAGGRTFGSSKEAVAALVISLFPRFPLSPTDNRCHLQVFRHLHVLASEARCVEAEEVNSRGDVQIPVKLTAKPGSPGAGGSIQLQTPCLAPPIANLVGLELGDALHYPIRLKDSEPEFSSLLRKGRIYVQKKASFQSLTRPQESPLEQGVSLLDESTQEQNVLPSSVAPQDASEAEIALHSLWHLASSEAGDAASLPAPLPVILWNLKIAAHTASGGQTDGFASSSGDSLGLPSTDGQDARRSGNVASGGPSPSLRYLHQLQERLEALLAQRNSVGLSIAGGSAGGLLSSLGSQDKVAASMLTKEGNWVDIAERVQRCSPEAVQLLARSVTKLGC